jgi:hypothetical protein
VDRTRDPAMISSAGIALAAPGALLLTMTLGVAGAVAAGLIVQSYMVRCAEEGRR